MRSGYALTLIDNLDSLIVFEQFIELRKAILWIIKYWTSDIDENVSIFETNIRILGGLISTHIFLSNDKSLWLTSYDGYDDDEIINGDTLNYCYDDDSYDDNYNNLICINCNHRNIYFFECYYNDELLLLSIELGERLLPAFVLSKTNIPYGTVNLRYGVPENETTIVCTSCAGSFLIEFGILSLLSDRWDDFYKYAKLSAVKLFHARNIDTGLIGKHINNLNGIWTQIDCSLGTFIDSYLEYLLKSYFIFYDDDLLIMFNELWSSLWYHLNDKFNYNSSWYTEVRINDGQQTAINHDTFASFWPGLLSLNGNLRLATNYLDSMIKLIIDRYQFIPEIFDLTVMRPIKGKKQYFLRPEFIESLYHIYSVTMDEYYIDTAWNIIKNINDTSRVYCGFATIQDIETHKLYNSMDSFWMSETLKYLYLMFSIDTDNNYFLFNNHKYKDIIFTTEGHLIPLNIIHKIWNKQLKYKNKTKHDFWKKYHWWNLEPSIWSKMFDQLRNENKLKFRKSKFIKYSEQKKVALLKNFFKFITNDLILYDEYQRIFIKKETNPLFWDIDKLSYFKNNTYDAIAINNKNKNIVYKKTFSAKNNYKIYNDEWIKLGSNTFWDCGQMITIRKKQTNQKLDDLIFKSWSLHICDSYVHTKCWIHRFIDNETCWI